VVLSAYVFRILFISIGVWFEKNGRSGSEQMKRFESREHGVSSALRARRRYLGREPGPEAFAIHLAEVGERQLVNRGSSLP